MKKFVLLAVWLLSAVSAEARTFRVRLVEDLGSLDWNYGEVNPEVVYQIMEGLYSTDHLGRPLPAAAQRFQWLGKKTKIRFFLRKNLRWSDGAPLCAQHFVDSWTRLQSQAFASPYAHYANVLKSYSAPNCQTLDVEFRRPTPEALALFSHYVFFPIRLDALQAHPKMFTDGVGLLVNGPYKVDTWASHQSLSLVRNVNYEDFSDHASIDRVEFRFIPEESTASILFDQKKVDWLKDVPPILRNPKTEARVEFNRYPSLITYYFGLNAKSSSLLADAGLRRALSAALNREELKKVLGSELRPTRSWLTADLFPDLQSLPEKPFDFSTVKVLLAKAVAENRMDLKLVIYNKPAHKLLAEWAQGQWEKNLGVTIPIETEEEKVYWSQMGVNPPGIYLSGVTAPYNHPRAFLQEFLSNSTANWTGWTSAEYDAAVNQERFQKAEDILENAGFVIPLYSRDTVALVQKQWKGFWINPLGQVFLKTVH